jgi:LytS/YehU family sensor histidine kinase
MEREIKFVENAIKHSVNISGAESYVRISIAISDDKLYFCCVNSTALKLKDYVVMYIGNQKLITAMNLKTIHQKLPQHLFLRVSKSYVVNVKYIDSFDHRNIYLSEFEIPLGEVYKKDFFSVFSGGSLNPEE